MHSRDHRRDVFRIDVGCNAVTQIEDMPGPCAVGLQHAIDFCFDCRDRRAQDRRIKIAL